MSPDLPVRPSLEHLRKQARERLRELKVRNPGVQLADAQHAVAREYGFASWPRLKAHIGALAADTSGSPPAGTPPPPAGLGGEPTPPDYGFNRYSDRAKRATFFSRWEAAQLGSPVIDVEHLLLGLVRARQDLADARPARFAPPIAAVRSVVASGSGVGEALPNTVIIPFSEATKVVIARAAETAESRRDAEICTAHLLLALAQSAPSMAASILARHSVTERSLLGEAEEFLVDG